MLFDSSLKQELNRSFGATLVVLVTVVMTMVLIRTLGLASNGNVNPAEVSLVLGFTVLGYLPTIVTLSLFVAMVSTLSRLYRDSEMVIWLTSGQGLVQLLRPLWRFGWPLILIVAALILWVWPWSNQQVQELRERYEKRGDLERVTPGQFQSSASGQRVFFIEKDQAGDLQGKNVFISITDADKTVIATARSGRIDLRGEERGRTHFVRFAAPRHQRQRGGERGACYAIADHMGLRHGQSLAHHLDRLDLRQNVIIPDNLGHRGIGRLP
jgi:lipopolysaccharide export system permease protein